MKGVAMHVDKARVDFLYWLEKLVVATPGCTVDGLTRQAELQTFYSQDYRYKLYKSALKELERQKRVRGVHFGNHIHWYEWTRKPQHLSDAVWEKMEK